MKRVRIPVALGLFFCIAVLSSLATERIAKLQAKDMAGLGSSQMLRLENAAETYFGPSSPKTAAETELNNTRTFTVYTSAETDTLLQDLRDNLAAQDKEIKLLKDNIKSLSDANDALTNRASNLEAKLDKLSSSR